MNSTLPPARDLPPHRHAQIRARVEEEVTGRRRPVRFAPLITAGVAAAAVVALVAVTAPWQQQSSQAGSASTTAAQALGTTAVTAPETSAPPAQAPTIPGLAPERIAQIEQGCPQIAGLSDKAVLYQYLDDAAGKFGLLYSQQAVLDCTVDGPTMPYNSGFSRISSVEWLPGELAVDVLGSASGGDGGKAAYAGQAGYEVAAGRVTAKVAKVTFSAGGDTVEATVANGTFLARIPRASNYVADGAVPGEIRAYDAQGKLLDTRNSTWPREECFVRPDLVIVAGPGGDPSLCKPAVAWR